MDEIFGACERDGHLSVRRAFRRRRQGRDHFRRIYAGDQNRPIAIPTTAGYQPGVEVYHVWETLNNLADIDLSAGDYVMTITIENAGGLNIDYLSFVR